LWVERNTKESSKLERTGGEGDVERMYFQNVSVADHGLEGRERDEKARATVSTGEAWEEGLGKVSEEGHY